MTGLNDGARQLLQRYNFPGNVRELRNLVERGVILADGPLLTPRELSDLTGAKAVGSAPKVGVELASIEEQTIRAAFAHAGGNQARTARLLGIGVNALRYRLRKFGLR